MTMIATEPLWTKHFVDALQTVLETMIGCQCNQVVVRTEPPASLGVLANIEFRGLKTGSLSISTSSDTACKAFAKMVQMEVEELDESVLDSLGEIANMTAGFGKRMLQEPELLIGLPAISVDFEHSFPNWEDNVCLDLESDLGSWMIHIGFEY